MLHGAAVMWSTNSKFQAEIIKLLKNIRKMCRTCLLRGRITNHRFNSPLGYSISFLHIHVQHYVLLMNATRGVCVLHCNYVNQILLCYLDEETTCLTKQWREKEEWQSFSSHSLLICHIIKWIIAPLSTGQIEICYLGRLFSFRGAEGVSV